MPQVVCTCRVERDLIGLQYWEPKCISWVNPSFVKGKVSHIRKLNQFIVVVDVLLTLLTAATISNIAAVLLEI